MHRSTIIKLYPTAEQAETLDRQLSVCRKAWNYFLALRTRHYKIYGKTEGFKSAHYVRCSRHLTCMKKREKFSYFSIPLAHALQAKLQDLDKAFVNMWKHKKGYPKFKKKGREDTMRFDRQFVKIDGNRIKIQKLGAVKFRGRLLEGQLRNVTVRKMNFGRYEASVMYEIEGKVRVAGERIGIDLNCHNITASDGKKYALPTYCFQDKIRYWSKAMCRRKMGSVRRDIARKHFGKWHYKASQKRNYVTQGLTTSIAYQDDTQARVVCMEDLALNNMTRKGGTRKKGLNRSMLDSCLGEIRRQFEYKTATAKVGRFFPSSKRCSSCGHKNTELTLDHRSWTCKECDTHHDRDVNAAVNVLQEATRALRGDGVKPAGALIVPEGICLGSAQMHR